MGDGYNGMSSGYPARGRQPVAPCRDCRAPMRWATTPAGSRIALDPVPLTDAPGIGVAAYLVVEHPRDWRLAVELKDGDLIREVLDLEGRVWASHFDTCPRRERPSLSDRIAP
jgi:hypothetical protein